MTMQEVKDIIIAKAAAYGFAAKEESFSTMPQIERATESYINIQFFTETNYEKTDFGNGIYCLDVEVNASVCRMNPNATPEELLVAAEEIKRGALLTKELQEMRLSYIHEV